MAIEPGNRRTLDEVEIRIRNREDYAIRVERLYFTYPFPPVFFASSNPAEIKAGDVSELPFEVPARDVMSLTLHPSRPYKLASGTSEFTPGIGMELRTGERYASKSAWH
jgi:hypothetical protein